MKEYPVNNPELPSDARRAPLEPFSRPSSPEHQEVQEMIVQGLRKALKTGAVRREQVGDYIQAYREGLIRRESPRR